MPNLFDPLKLRSIVLKNRIGVSPMCQYSCENKDGIANDWHVVNAGSFAVGGAALFIAEATAVEPRGRIAPQDLGIWSDAHIEPLARMVKFLKQYNTVPGIQLAHAGRKASTTRPWEPNSMAPIDEANGGWKKDIIAPSAIAFDAKHPVPREMSLEEIAQVKRAFRDAAARALKAGFEFVEIHGAHGYLINSFYSPISNKRTDQYGGSFENRIRFLLEIVKETREVWPEHLPLSVRLSATDWVEGGWTKEDSIELAKRLKASGVDIVDCSSGANIAARIPVGPGYQVPLSEAVRTGAQVATAAVGMIISPHQADEIIANERADLILLGRELLRNPYWPREAAKALAVKDPFPTIVPQHRRAYPPTLPLSKI